MEDIKGITMSKVNKINKNQISKKIKINSTIENTVLLTKDYIERLSTSGWERKTITDEPRLTELVELYESIGFEVHLEPLSNELLKLIGEECKSCYIDNWERYKVIFTRKSKA